MESSEKIVKVLLQQKHQWASIDKTMHIELKALEMLSAEAGMQLLHTKVLEACGEWGKAFWHALVEEVLHPPARPQEVQLVPVLQPLWPDIL